MNKPQQPSLDDLGLGDPINVQKMVSKMPAIKSDPPRRPPASPPRSPVRQPAAQAPRPIPPQRSSYPWLTSYIVWMRVLGVIGNVYFLMIAVASAASPEEYSLMDAIIGILSSNFLFVVASLVQLALDAKSDLATIAERPR